MTTTRWEEAGENTNLSSPEILLGSEATESCLQPSLLLLIWFPLRASLRPWEHVLVYLSNASLISIAQVWGHTWLIIPLQFSLLLSTTKRITLLWKARDHGESGGNVRTNAGVKASPLILLKLLLVTIRIKKMISWRMSLEIVTHKHFKSYLKSSPRKAAMNSLSYTYIYGALLSSKMTEGLVKGIGFSFHFPNKIQSVTINILNLCLPSIVRVELLMPRLPRALYKTCGANWATLPLCTIREFLHVKWWSKFLLESSHGITSIINSVPSNLQQLCHLQLPS